MKRIISVISLVLLCSCSGSNVLLHDKDKQDIYSTGIVCHEEVLTKISDFTLKCIKNGNPKSDEEPEGWIKLCKEMGLDIYCISKIRIYHQSYDIKLDKWQTINITHKNIEWEEKDDDEK